jgi:hypothetical protein
MPCIACEITGNDGQAVATISATSGLGLATCARHTEVTERVLRRLQSYEAGMRASFVTAGLTTEQPAPDARKPVEINSILYRLRQVWPDTDWLLREPPTTRPSLAWHGGPTVHEVGEELRWPDLAMIRDHRP